MNFGKKITPETSEEIADDERYKRAQNRVYWRQYLRTQRKDEDFKVGRRFKY